ncbi:hypothetical protein KI387_007223, partial [Taxus chinensis]
MKALSAAYNKIHIPVCSASRDNASTTALTALRERKQAELNSSMHTTKQARGSITALAFMTNQFWLVSAAEDCTARVWDVVTGQVIRTFDHRKGNISNLLVIPQIFFHTKGCQKNSSGGSLPRIPVSSLEKSSQQRDGLEETVTVIPSYCSLEEELVRSGSHSAASMKQQIMDLEQEWSPEAIQMKVDSSVENRIQATSMIKHMIE